MYVWPFTSVLDDHHRLFQLASVCGGICGLVFVILGLAISLEIFIVLLVYQMITSGEVSTALLLLVCVLGTALLTVFACLFAFLLIYFRRRRLCSQRRVTERRKRPPTACTAIYEGIDREYHIYFKPLTKFNPYFQGIANLDTLVPQLCQREVLLPNEAEELYYRHTRCEKITHLLAVLSRKGTDGVEGLIDSLEADTQHPAHHQLAHILRKEYYNFLPSICGALPHTA